MSDKYTETVILLNELGLHARAAAAFVKIASKYNSEIKVKKNNSIINGKSITSLIMLMASKGTQIEIIVTGDDAFECINELKDLVNNKFGEE